MIINYLNEAGVFGSYKKATAQSNVANVKKELAREAALSILQNKCDELTELFLDMLNEVNSTINAISSKYNYKLQSGIVYHTRPHSNIAETSNLLELSNCIANKYFTMSRKKEMQLNIIKNVYCNRLALEYMISHGCFILPLVDTKRRWYFFNDSKEIIPYRNMAKTVATAAEKVIKSHLLKFPSYASAIPNNVKIVLLQDTFNADFNATYRSMQEVQLFSYMGFTGNGVEFNYPGQGSSCLNHILDNYTTIACHCTLYPIKSEEHYWKAIADPSTWNWMFNKIVFVSSTVNLSAVSANNFYGIKLLKFALDNGMLSNEYSRINISIENVLKNIESIKQLMQEVSNNGLNKIITYQFNNNDSYIETYTETLIKIGKEITPEQAKRQGILIGDLKRRVYEFDYNNTAEVKTAAKDIIDGCSKFLTDANIKKLAEDKMEKYLTVVMSKVVASRPDCVSSFNKILLCDYHKKSEAPSNIRVVIDPNKIEISKNGNLVFYIAVDFKLPVRGVNPKYNNKALGMRNNGKNYEFISGKKIKIEIPL